MNPKKECPICKKTKRTRCFIYNKKLVKFVCRMCHKKNGNNKFYIPNGRRWGSFTQKSQFFKLLLSQGISYEEAKRRANIAFSTRRIRRFKRKVQIKEAKEKQKAITQRKKFMEGLK